MERATRQNPLYRLQGEHTRLSITLIVSPAAGKLRLLPPRRFHHGREWVDEGQPVVRIEHGSKADVVTSPIGGHFGGVLGRDGEPVTAGQAIAWVEPAAEEA
jgi:biotin carboxyl carrier protein